MENTASDQIEIPYELHFLRNGGIALVYPDFPDLSIVCATKEEIIKHIMPVIMQSARR